MFEDRMESTLLRIAEKLDRIAKAAERIAACAEAKVPTIQQQLKAAFEDDKDTA